MQEVEKDLGNALMSKAALIKEKLAKLMQENQALKSEIDAGSKSPKTHAVAIDKSGLESSGYPCGPALKDELKRIIGDLEKSLEELKTLEEVI
jgi:hypothetical protein